MRTLLSLLVVCATLCSPVWAACTNCPNPPCQIQQCPPEGVELFTNLSVAGMTTGIGGEVEIDETLSVSVSDINSAGSGEFDLELTFVMTEVPAFTRTFYYQVDAYQWTGSTWVLDETSVLEPIYTIQSSGCSSQPCYTTGWGTCQANTCWKSTNCDGYCLIATGACRMYGTCECDVHSPPPCIDDIPGPNPSVDIRRAACKVARKCTLRIIDVSEG